MSSDKNPNIKALSNLILKHKIAIEISKTVFLADRKDYPEVILTLNNKSFTFFVDDEYNDFRYNYPILNFCVVLRDLEDYKFSNDYLLWCAERYIDASDEKTRTYYMSLDKTYTEIESILGEVNSFISSWDFEMSAGEARALREENY